MLSTSSENIVGDSLPKWRPDFIKLKDESGSSEDVYYSASFQGLPSEFEVVAQKELNETEENKRVGIKRLREYLKRENMPDVDDQSLMLVLRNCKYKFKKAEMKLKKFLKARKTILEQLEGADLKAVEMAIDDKGVGVLPFRDKKGRVIFFTRPNAMDEERYSIDSVMLAALAFAMVVIPLPITSVVGMAYIGECKFKSVASYLRLLKGYHQYMWTFLDLPIRIGRSDMINENNFTRWFIAVVRPFISSKIMDRVSFFGTDVEKLQSAYHPDILPEEFGGRMGPLDPTSYKDIALDFLRKLQAESQALKEASVN